MTWLLKLYPPRWRRRYGDEFVELIATQPFTLGGAIDVIAGAIDAWIHPQMSTAPTTSKAKGEATMLAKVMRFKCAGYGPNVTSTDQWKSLAVMLGGTVLLTLVWMWASRRLDDNPYVDAFSPMAFLLPLLFSMRHTSLKGRSPGVQAIFIVGSSIVLTALFLLAGWIGSRL